MELTRVKIEDVNRGDMIPGTWGAAVADTLSFTADGMPMWWDTNGQRHTWAGDGTALIYVTDVQTQAFGESASGGRHILRRETPESSLSAACGSRATLGIWESGTALASITCRTCRSMYNLTGSHDKTPVPAR